MTAVSPPGFRSAVDGYLVDVDAADARQAERQALRAAFPRAAVVTVAGAPAPAPAAAAARLWPQ